MRTIRGTITDRSLDVLSEREKAVSVRGDLKRALGHLDHAFAVTLSTALDDNDFGLLCTAEANIKAVREHLAQVAEADRG